MFGDAWGALGMCREYWVGLVVFGDVWGTLRMCRGYWMSLGSVGGVFGMCREYWVCISLPKVFKGLSLHLQPIKSRIASELL